MSNLIKELKCKKCKHRWLPRVIDKPKMCPKCKTYSWEDEKEIQKDTEEF